MKTRSLLAVMLLVTLTGVASGKKKMDPAVYNRMVYGGNLYKSIEIDGWSGDVVLTVGRQECRVFCKAGDRTVMVITGFGPPEGMVRFVAQEIEPRMKEMKDLGFLWIEIRGNSSATFPNGIWSIDVDRGWICINDECH